MFEPVSNKIIHTKADNPIPVEAYPKEEREYIKGIRHIVWEPWLPEYEKHSLEYITGQRQFFEVEKRFNTKDEIMKGELELTESLNHFYARYNYFFTVIDTSVGRGIAILWAPPYSPDSYRLVGYVPYVMFMDDWTQAPINWISYWLSYPLQKLKVGLEGVR